MGIMFRVQHTRGGGNNMSKLIRLSKKPVQSLPCRHRCFWPHLRVRAIKTNIADSLNIVIQIDRRPGTRFVSAVLEIRGYEPEADRYDLYQVYGQSWENA